MAVDEKLKQFANTEAQWEKYVAFCEHGGYRPAGRALNCTKNAIKQAVSAIKQKAADSGLPLDAIEEHKLKREIKEKNQKIRELAEQAVTDERYQRFMGEALSATLMPPKWLYQKNKGSDRAIATAMLSDTHFDEVVNPQNINGVNAYNRAIATLRLRKFFENTISLCKDYCSGIQIDGLVLALGGDMVSGNIHEELAETNEQPIMDTVLYWSEQLAAGIRLLMDHFDKLHVPCVTGNHGRNHKKPKAKIRAKDSFDWLIYKLVERELSGTEGLTFSIPLETDVRWNVYDTRMHMTHGDQFKGGNGISGIFTPIWRGYHKKLTREQSVSTPYDILLMGHFHQLIDMGAAIVNGSLKGYDEWTASMNFGFQPPQQAFFLIDPKWGKTITAPVHVQSDKENWAAGDYSIEAEWLKGAA